MGVEHKVGHYKMTDHTTGQTWNMMEVDHKDTIWDPNSEFLRELELYKIKSDIKPRKSTMMAAQMDMIQDFCSEVPTKKLYVPGNTSGFIAKPLVVK